MFYKDFLIEGVLEAYTAIFRGIKSHRGEMLLII